MVDFSFARGSDLANAGYVEMKTAGAGRGMYLQTDTKLDPPITQWSDLYDEIVHVQIRVEQLTVVQVVFFFLFFLLIYAKSVIRII